MVIGNSVGMVDETTYDAAQHLIVSSWVSDWVSKLITTITNDCVESVESWYL